MFSCQLPAASSGHCWILNPDFGTETRGRQELGEEGRSGMMSQISVDRVICSLQSSGTGGYADEAAVIPKNIEQWISFGFSLILLIRRAKK